MYASVSSLRGRVPAREALVPRGHSGGVVSDRERSRCARGVADTRVRAG
ncbi:hypothetical protein [Salinigranum sp.]